MHVGAAHGCDNFGHGIAHNFYEAVVVHLLEGLVPDLNDTKCDLAHVRAGTKARRSREMINR